MKSSTKRTAKQKAFIAIIFGLLGFYINFHAVSLLETADFEISMLYGLLFPLIVSLFWGWKYGLLSALAGGCQSMWWLWEADGYGILYSVPVFSLWIVWHGWWSNKRRNSNWHWLKSMYIVEILFRIVIEIGFFTIFRWLISNNPPFWNNSITNDQVSYEWLFFVARKHVITAYILLIISDVLLHLTFVRRFFVPEEQLDDNNTTYVISISLFVGFIIWILHSLFDYFYLFKSQYSFIELAFTKIPPCSGFAKIMILLASTLIGLLLSRLYRNLKKKNDGILEAEQKFHQLINISFDLIITLDKTGKVNYINHAAQNYLENRSVLGASFFDLIAPKYRDTAMNSFGMGMLNNHMQIFEFQFDYFDTQKLIFEASGTTIYDKNNNATGTVIILRDISDRKHNEELLKKADLNWQNSFNSMDEIFLLLDKNHNIININQKGLEILDLKKEDVIGNKCFSVIYERSEPETICPAREAEMKGGTSSKVYFAKNLGRYLSLRCSPVYNSENEIMNYVIIMEDISSRVKVEKGLRKYREDLEKQLEEQEKRIDQNNKEFQYSLKLFEQREKRIKDLKIQVKELKKELKERY